MESQTLFLCPVCKQGQVIKAELPKKTLFGSKTKTEVGCKNCSTKFIESEGGYYLNARPSIKDKQVREEYSILLTRFPSAEYLKPEEWVRIAQGGVSDREQVVLDEIQEEKNILTKLDEGDMSVIPVIGSVPIMLQKNEIAYLSIDGVSYVEERTRTKYVGGTRGMSVRVTKGVSMRVGGFDAERVPISEQVELDQGTFYVTNKRIIFSGPRKNVAFPINKILEIESWADGISISRTGKQKTESYLGELEIPSFKHQSPWLLVKAIIQGVFKSG